MDRFFVVLLLLWTVSIFSQQLSGNVADEEGNKLFSVLVINMKSEAKVFTNNNGEFIIDAGQNDEIRFVKKGFERASHKISVKDLQNSIAITLIKSAEEIEEVEIVHKPTGNLAIDNEHVGDKKEVKKLKNETANYISAYSTPEVLAPKHGEFVQPVGPGFSVGAIKSKWEDIDFMEFLIKTLGQDFFINDLKLKQSEISSFIFYIFRNFERKNILFYGFCPPVDLARFSIEADNKISSYRNNIPNIPPKKKKR